MKEKQKIIVSITLLSAFVYFLVWLQINKNDTEILNIDNAQKDIINDITKVQALEQEVYKWVNMEEMDAGILEAQDNELLQRYREKQGVVEFLFASILMDNPDLFIQSFEPEVISKDLFKIDTFNKSEVAEMFISKISRNGKLEQVGYENSKGILGAKSDKAEVRLRYSDGIEVTLSLTFEKSGSIHQDGGEIYSISTSVWEIIDSINKASGK
ncbi:hypothetical protein NC797_07065 [Aquibacillus sp. 3ASR75-11]|uniref:Uncharacterized protein n=1 Tax=Terrihalobacillus insolitus TaxID=2950438 RepID=A0A9X4ALD6_9BACI|nr:hypothetical protein [Terrihalobacillus insolitus]MDC3424267.1 hypothetical protein [Terrihalobacillus insolitus]